MITNKMLRATAKKRVESDVLGRIEVPAGALYGVQTRRAMLNFPVRRQRTLGDYPDMIAGLMMVKRAAANVNGRCRFLPRDKALAIAEAAQSVINGSFRDQFPVHRLHGGGGTSANMNANEVLANLAEESLGGRRGEYRIIHPNDHVNCNQSTNDVYPTACHVAVIRAWPELAASLDRLALTLERRGRELAREVRIARTCLQDAVEITFGDFLGGSAAMVRRIRKKLAGTVDRLHAVNLGGTIVGRSLDAPKTYRSAIVPELAKVTGDKRYRQAADLYDSAQNPDEMAAVSSYLDLAARCLIKLAKDFRLMASGPEAGLMEIRLPAVQPGSSIMPGKINPVMPEFLIQACFQVMGDSAACRAAVDHGELDLNVWEGVMVFNILDAMEVLATAVSAFEERCVRRFVVDSARNRRNADSIIPLLTRAMHKRGYSKTSDIVKKANGDPAAIRRLLRRNRIA
jgi:aspartate ammonia-lyase